MDLHVYLITNVLDTFTETPGIRYHHVDVAVVVLVVFSIACVGVIVPGTSDVSMCVAVHMVVLGFESAESPYGVFAPD